MVAEPRSNPDAERMAVIETRMDSFVTRDQHECDLGDIKVVIAALQGEISNLRTDIKNLTWQIAVVVAILSSIISFLVSRIPV